MDHALMPEHLRPVFEQLLTGITDIAASRHLNMSPRTFSRRVAELLDWLEAGSRFEAGVRAAQRGLLYRPPARPARPAREVAVGRQ
jgi:DNA-binding NarL/FixJ family response regulator